MRTFSAKRILLSALLMIAGGMAFTAMFATAQQGGGVVGVAPFTGCVQWKSTNIITGITGACGTGSGNVSGPGSSTSGDVPTFSGTTGKTLQDQGHLNDNGTTVTSTESIDTKTNATIWEIPNASSTGTVVNQLAKLTGAPSTAVVTGTADLTGAIGIVVGGAGTTGSAQIAITGQASCIFDGATTAGDYVINSPTTAGDCNDAGVTPPTGKTAVGIVLSTNVGTGTYAIALFPPTPSNIFAGGSGFNTAAVHTFTASQREAVVSLTISTATFTPNFDTGQNFTLTLVHASCPCTLANPSTTPVAGQAGVIEVIQSATGSDLISTWGSDYTYGGGTSTIALSAGANARDYLSYYVADSTHIVLSSGSLNATH